MQWYYTVQGQRQGPVDEGGLEDLVRRGVIQDDTYVWREGLAEWQLYGAVKPKPVPERIPLAAPPAKPVENPPVGGSFGAPPAGQTSAARPAAAPAYSAPNPAGQTFTHQPAAAKSKSYLFYYPVLRALGDGRVIRTCVVWGLKIGTFAAILGGLVSAFGILSGVQGLGGSGMLGAVLMAIVILGTSLCVAQVLWYRAGSVATLRDSDYTLIPIASILFRTGGESSATMFAGLGAGTCLFLWLSPGGLGETVVRGVLPAFVPVSAGFLGGIVALLFLGLLAFLTLIAGYLAAEWIGVLVDIAESIHKIRRVAEKSGVNV